MQKLGHSLFPKNINMATKLQELLEELKGLKRFYGEIDDGSFDLREAKTGDLTDWYKIEELITKYSKQLLPYKEEQTVRVIRNIHHNPFIVGFTVILKEKRAGNLWLCSDGRDRGFLTEEEFEPIN